MIRIVNEIHDREWAQYLKDSKAARQEQAEMERSIKAAFGSEELSEEWQQDIDRSRKIYLKEWGINGRRASGIFHRYDEEKQKELSELLKIDSYPVFTTAEIDDMYEAYIASQDRSTEEGTQLQILGHIHNEQRNEVFNMMQNEMQAVTDVYMQEGQDIPQATQRRFEKRIAAGRLQWDGVVPKTPLDEFATLDKAGLDDPIIQRQHFMDLKKSHDIIASHYGGNDKIPASSNSQIYQEIGDFYKEMRDYKAPSANPEAEEFKERLQTIRDAQQTQKPKMK